MRPLIDCSHRTCILIPYIHLTAEPLGRLLLLSRCLIVQDISEVFFPLTNVLFFRHLAQLDLHSHLLIPPEQHGILGLNHVVLRVTRDIDCSCVNRLKALGPTAPFLWLLVFRFAFLFDWTLDKTAVLVLWVRRSLDDLDLLFLFTFLLDFS